MKFLMRIAATAAGLLAVLFAASCGGQTPTISPPGGISQALTGGQPSFPSTSVPAPAVLAGHLPLSNAYFKPPLPTGRSTSYFEGSEVNGSMSYHLAVFNPGDVSHDGDETLDFYPHYQDGSDVAYRIYNWDMTSFTGPNTITLNWQTRPADSASYYIGLVNQAYNRWEWFMAPPNDVFNFASFAPYIDASGDMELIVITYATGGQPRVAAGKLSSLAVGAHTMLAVGGFHYHPQDGPVLIMSNVNYMPANIISYQSLPLAVDYEPLLPPVGNQGTGGSCAYWATISGALNLELASAYEGLYDPNSLNDVPSVRYAFIQSLYMKNVPLPANSADTDNVFSYLYNYGVPSAAEVSDATPSQNPHYWERDWDGTVDDHSKYLDIEDYWLISPADGDAQLQTIKKMVALHRRGVVLGISFSLFQSFSGTREHPWVVDFTPPYIGVGHAVCVVGYDDSIQALKVRNSWGNNDDQHGYLWLSYTNFDQAHHACIALAGAIMEDMDEDAAGQYFHVGIVGAPAPHFRASNGDIPNAIQLSWDHTHGATEYIIYRDFQAIPYYDYHVTDQSQDYLTWIDPNAQAGDVHTYWIRGIFPYGGGSYAGKQSRPVYGWASGGSQTGG